MGRGGNGSSTTSRISPDPPTLIALTVRPRSRSELWEMAGVSESTIRRPLHEFEDRDWVSREGY